MHETLINKDKEIIESVESFKTERVFQATKENVQEKEEKINCLEVENHKMSMRVDELETEAKSVLMELNFYFLHSWTKDLIKILTKETSKKEIVLELEKLIVTQQETIDTVKKEGEEERTRKMKVLLDLIKQYAPYSSMLEHF